ncbi:CoA transferase subunit A [Chloroflexota bacterium]
MIIDEYKRAPDKTMSLKKAIATFLHQGCSLTLGGFGGRQPLAAVHEVVRQNIGEMTILTDSSIDAADILVGANLVKKLEGAYFGMGLLGPSPNIRRAYESGIPRTIEIEDYSNYSAGLRFLAGAMDIPFLPTKSLLGTDILKYNNRIITQKDPYNSELMALVPAANPDVAIIHTHRADSMGNAQIYGFLASDENKARASKRVIITCEEIVPTEIIRKDPHLTVIPFYCTDAVVEIAYGAHCSPLPYYYMYDILFARDYVQQSKTYEGFLEWLDKWVCSCDSPKDYFNKVGWKRLKRLASLEQKASDATTEKPDWRFPHA